MMLDLDVRVYWNVVKVNVETQLPQNWYVLMEETYQINVRFFHIQRVDEI